MRATSLVALLALVAGLALAQSQSQSQTQTASPAPNTDQSDTGSKTHRSPGPPIDKGPYTPQADRAYQGGGVILQGAPGQPAPTPQPTPPGQVPQGSVNPQ